MKRIMKITRYTFILQRLKSSIVSHLSQFGTIMPLHFEMEDLVLFTLSEGISSTKRIYFVPPDN